MVSGFFGLATATTPKIHCIDTQNTGADWVQKVSLQNSDSTEGTELGIGLSHGAVAIVGSKFYICGGVSRHCRHIVSGTCWLVWLHACCLEFSNPLMLPYLVPRRQSWPRDQRLLVLQPCHQHDHCHHKHPAASWGRCADVQSRAKHIYLHCGCRCVFIFGHVE